MRRLDFSRSGVLILLFDVGLESDLRAFAKVGLSVGVVGRGINRLAVGIGMIPRGEVGLIFAGIGASLVIKGQPILSQNIYSAIVMMVLITTLITPIGLRWVFGKSASSSSPPA